jgi:stage II sporulation protein AB (anti-sigma F factor)
MFAHATGAKPEQVEAVRLAVSEALTNAVMHAYGADSGAVHVSASRARDELWVRIADDGHGVEAGYESPGLGIGLHLIACIADYFAITKRSEGGTEIRMRFGASARQPSGDVHLVAA